MQSNCLLEKLDWIFTSSGWSLSFPNTSAYAISHATSDHVPYMTQMDAMVPKSNIFRFENFWVSLPDFLPMVKFSGIFPMGEQMEPSLFQPSSKLYGEALKPGARRFPN
jgi:hypothetical protein